MEASGVRVCVRVRPASGTEAAARLRSVVRVLDARLLTFDPRQDEEPFFYHGTAHPTPSYLRKANKNMQLLFDRVFDETATNEDVFDASTRDLIASLMEGYNCSVFVYGATGAGKTFTMLGHRNMPGITYLTMQELFRAIEQRRDEIEFDICVSYLEIYNENVQDLLQPSGPLQLREDRKYGVQVAGLFSKSINTAQDLLDMLDQGNKNRTQHPTDANAESSRSHAVFQVYVKMRTKATNQAKLVKLSMIDLAGSERASATGCVGERFKEGANINRSLLSLGNCINKLADGSKFIPYRDSKLTRLLKDSLGGNCRTVMIANISPTIGSYEDTYNTLKYATRASKIQQKIKKNIINCDGHVGQYIKQVEELSLRVVQLEAEIARYKENGSSEILSNEFLKQKKINVNRLNSCANIYFGNLNNVLKMKRRQRFLMARAAHKRRAAICLATLCSKVADKQLMEACQKDLARLELSSLTLRNKSEALQNELKASLNTLSASERDFTALSAEVLSTNNSLEYLVKEFNYKRDIIISEGKNQHLLVITNLLQTEMNKINSFVQNSSELLKKYYMRFRSHEMFTTVMHDEYDDMIRQAKSSQTVTWDSEKEDVECVDSLYTFITDLSIDKLIDLPRLSTYKIVISPEGGCSYNKENVDVAKSPSVAPIENNINSTYVEDVVEARDDLPEINDVENVFNSRKRKNPDTIDPNSLNSTFVLSQKEFEEPNSKKIDLTKSFKPKKVLWERTNFPSTDKLPLGKVQPTISKITPFKRAISIPPVSRDAKSGFGSSADRFQQPLPTSSNVQVGYKTVRIKKRSALAANVLPYNRQTPAANGRR